MSDTKLNSTADLNYGNFFSLDSALSLISEIEDQIHNSGLEQFGGASSDSQIKSVTENQIPSNEAAVVRREKPHPPRTDPHRLSRANLEDSGDLELDAILNELCALENEFNSEISSIQSNSNIKSNSIQSTPNTQLNYVESNSDSKLILPNPMIQQNSALNSIQTNSSVFLNLPLSGQSNIASINSTNSKSVQQIVPNSQKFENMPLIDNSGRSIMCSNSLSSVQVKNNMMNVTSSELSTYKPKCESHEETNVQQTIGNRTDSPDNDSAFSDNVSMLSSSESSASSGASAGVGVTSKHNIQLSNLNNVKNDSNSKADEAARLKAEKIRMALEKLKEANVKKLFIKAFSADGSSKSLLVDEKMRVSHVCRVLTDKNHVRVDPKWAIVEHLPELYMDRIYEDDEMLVENLLLWTRDSKNRLLFAERPDKYDLFVQPEKYLLGNSTNNLPVRRDVDYETRNNLIEELFSSSRVPEVEGALFLKSEGKKAWKRFYFVLRQSGLYYCPKGKSSRLSKDLLCLSTFDTNQVYRGVGWKKKYKAPTDYGFAIKQGSLQTRSNKHIKYLCSETYDELMQWITAIRVAKNGQRLWNNHRSLIEDMAHEDVDILASSRSFSLASFPHSANSRGSSEPTTPSSENQSLDSCLSASLNDDDSCSFTGSTDSSSQDTPVNTIARAPRWSQNNAITDNINNAFKKGISSGRSQSSSSSSGCLSERSSTGTPSLEGGFDAEFPQQGTIKRKPSASAKIPLTSTTRHLVKEVDSLDNQPIIDDSFRRSLRISEEVSTLRRRPNPRPGKSSVTSSIISNGHLDLNPNEDIVDSSSKPTFEQRITELSISISEASTAPGSDSPNIDALPPPPHELLASTLSLNSFPPPPDESSLPSISDDMTASSISLAPPPPPPLIFKEEPKNIKSPPATPPKPNSLPLTQNLGTKFPLVQKISSPPSFSSKSKVDFSDPIYAVKAQIQSPVKISSSQIESMNIVIQGTTQNLNSPIKKVKKITFLDDVQTIPISPCPSIESPDSPKRAPLLPKRSQVTKVTNPGKLSAPGNKATPPKSFLNNLQRVMQKKWHVAQKCRDFDKTPHEVLGFRDPIPTVETERNVGAWIQEHYGSLYENLAPNSDLNERTKDSARSNMIEKDVQNVLSTQMGYPATILKSQPHLNHQTRSQSQINPQTYSQPQLNHQTHSHSHINFKIHNQPQKTHPQSQLNDQTHSQSQISHIKRNELQYKTPVHTNPLSPDSQRIHLTYDVPFYHSNEHKNDVPFYHSNEHKNDVPFYHSNEHKNFNQPNLQRHNSSAHSTSYDNHIPQNYLQSPTRICHLQPQNSHSSHMNERPNLPFNQQVIPNNQPVTELKTSQNVYSPTKPTHGQPINQSHIHNQPTQLQPIQPMYQPHYSSSALHNQINSPISEHIYGNGSEIHQQQNFPISHASSQPIHRKRPPPPLPKRSETTQLSSR